MAESAEKITEYGGFNPARYVYLNKRKEKCMDLPARMAWFQKDHPAWRLALDGVRLVSVELWADHEYYAEDRPNESPEVVREKENVCYAIGHFSMIDGKGYRVTTVGASVRVSDDYFMEELMERGYFLLLDLSGYNPYNISAESWLRLYHEKSRGTAETVKKLSEIESKYNPSGATENLHEAPAAESENKPSAHTKKTSKPKPSAIEQAFEDDLFEPRSESESEEEPFIRDEEDKEDGDVSRGMIESIARMKDFSKEQLLRIFKMTLPPDDLNELDGDEDALEERFERLCLNKVGDEWANIQNDPISRNIVVAELEKRLKRSMSAQKGNVR